MSSLEPAPLNSSNQNTKIMSQTFIYAIYCPNKNEVKIGYAGNPISRLSQLQTGTTDRLDLLMTFVGGIAEEKQIHKELADYRISGEWFRYSPLIFSVLSDFMSAQFNSKGCNTVDLKSLVGDLEEENQKLLKIAESSVEIIESSQQSLIQQRQAWKSIIGTFLNLPTDLDDDQFMLEVKDVIQELSGN